MTTSSRIAATCSSTAWGCSSKCTLDGSITLAPVSSSTADNVCIRGSNWKWPTIEGLHSFKGQLLHSANYDNSIDLAHKRVAVIGSGSSGIQIIPTIQGKVKQLGAYLRSSTWIVPPFGSQYIKKDANGENIYEYSQEERDAFLNEPDALLDYRRMLEKDVSHRCKCPRHEASYRHLNFI